MSENRSAAMNKIQASIGGVPFQISKEDLNRLAGEEVQLDEAASVSSSKDQLQAERLKQAQVRTDQDIQRLEAAKKKVSSQAVKNEIDEEVRRIKLAREEAALAEQQDRISSQRELSALNIAQKQAGLSEKEQRLDEEQRKGAIDLEIKRLALERQQETALASRTKRAQEKIVKAYDVARGTVKTGWNTLSTISTPGSIFLPVTILLIFFFLLVQVNGHSRAEWLWLTLIGDAHLSGENTISKNDVTTPGAFSNQGQPTNTFVYTPGSSFTGVSV